jgi:hypothetical protein
LSSFSDPQAVACYAEGPIRLVPGTAWLLVGISVLALSACVRTSLGRLVSLRCVHIAALTPTSTADEAILAARKIWYCIEPPGKDATDEKSWREDFTATKSGGIWSIHQVIPREYAGGGLSMSLSAEDGRFLDYVLTQ